MIGRNTTSGSAAKKLLHDDKNDNNVADGISDDVSSYSISDGNEERDEVKEIEKFSRKETLRVNFWRMVVCFALLATALAVTLTTYSLLQKQQKQDFDTAFEQFSRTVVDSAIQFQDDVIEGFESAANTISAYVDASNQTWPFVVVQPYELFAHDFRKQSKLEFLGMNNFVTREQRADWESFSAATYMIQAEAGHIYAYGNLEHLIPEGFHPYLGTLGPDGFQKREEMDLYAPFWHCSPPSFTYNAHNWDTLSHPNLGMMGRAMRIVNEVVLSPVMPYHTKRSIFAEGEHEALHSKLADSLTDYPHTFWWGPVYKKPRDPSSGMVAVIGGAGSWDVALRELLPDGVNGIVVILENTCNQTYTYELDGIDAFYKGEGDLHDDKYDSYEVMVTLSRHIHSEYEQMPGICLYSMRMYPSDTFAATYDSVIPEVFAVVVAATFVMVAVVFYVYDRFVQKKNEKIIENAARSNAIVTSLFPAQFRDQMMEQSNAKGVGFGTKSQMKDFLSGGDGNQTGNSKPLADLFLETTVLFADLVGFTAWSSVRSPEQVFVLLETVYKRFDVVAKRRRVFKVETVGDCYVAVTGLPDPRKDHAIAMARFARQILSEFQGLVQKLEVTLGPDTSDLDLRVGMHSGPVTAGVLRGDRSRFQLFGDTVNFTSRIEASGKASKIHLSSETAALLVAGGKQDWVEARSDVVRVKGKGDLHTFWLAGKDDEKKESNIGGWEDNSADFKPTEPLIDGVDERTMRLIDWNTTALLKLIKKIVARRNAAQATNPAKRQMLPNEKLLQKGETFLEEVKEIIVLPEFDAKVAGKEQAEDDVVIDEAVVEELRTYVTRIAKMYRRNAFHNFEHASHVTMSVIKLLSRIVAPSELEYELEKIAKDEGGNKVAASLHDHTYGITSDPLTHFACAFSALIHDVDHVGVPNTRLVEENPELGARFKSSTAEQNSLDLAWKLLMQLDFSKLRATIFATQDDLARFRALCVNSVMATDIADKDLKQLRNERWAKAFDEGKSSKAMAADKGRDAINRKATIVIEHIIQASDISHTMQHWHVYRKWNARLFEELFVGYIQGRSTSHPGDFWVKGEIGFFDFYIIPLAKKLKDCGVFGVSSDEFLNYANCNRREWEEKGQSIVDEMLAELSKKYGQVQETAPSESPSKSFDV